MKCLIARPAIDNIEKNWCEEFEIGKKIIDLFNDLNIEYKKTQGVFHRDDDLKVLETNTKIKKELVSYRPDVYIGFSLTALSYLLSSHLNPNFYHPRVVILAGFYLFDKVNFLNSAPERIDLFWGENDYIMTFEDENQINYHDNTQTKKPIDYGQEVKNKINHPNININLLMNEGHIPNSASFLRKIKNILIEAQNEF